MGVLLIALAWRESGTWLQQVSGCSDQTCSCNVLVTAKG